MQVFSGCTRVALHNRGHIGKTGGNIVAYPGSGREKYMSYLPVSKPAQVVLAHARCLAKLCAAGEEGRVHSVFAHAINMQFFSMEPELCVLVTANGDFGPGVFRCSLSDFESWAIAPGSSIAIDHSTLRLGNLALCLQGCKASLPERLPFPENTAAVRRAVDMLNAMPRQTGVQAGLEERLGAMLEKRSSALMQALKAGNSKAAQEAALSLLGLGVGLTPSGDDILLGFLAVLTMPQSPVYLQEFCNFVALEAVQRTNSISASGLLAAARGELRQTIVNFLKAIGSASRIDIEATLARVLAIGSTSGADTVCGIIKGFEVALALKPPTHEPETRLL